jgi:GPH family glycoside/pentoside/hexuronide:cation symporter
MNSDIVDYDELRTGERREGAFASIFSWIVKASFSIGLGLGGPVVQWLGFTTRLGAHQSAGTFMGMRIAFAVVPTLMLGGAMLILYHYPLTRERMSEVRRELESRRGKV